MKIFLSAVEGKTTKKAIDEIISSGIKLHYNLMSYYYIEKNNYEHAVHIRDNSELIMIDSGAHSFQFGTKVNWLEYTKRYAEFIKRFDRPNVVGYFEMDIDNIIGYEKVLELRKILENVSDKIIPVWHPPRGINNFEEMCKKYHGKTIAIGGFRGTDIKDHQYIMFLKVAKKYNCKVHFMKKKSKGGKGFFYRSIGSSLVGKYVDAVIFTFIGLSFLPMTTKLIMVANAPLVQIAIEAIVFPVTNFVSKLVKKAELRGIINEEAKSTPLNEKVNV